MFTIIIKFIHRLIEIKEESEVLSTVFAKMIKYCYPKLDDSKVTSSANLISGTISALAIVPVAASVYLEYQDTLDKIGTKILGFCGWKGQE